MRIIYENDDGSIEVIEPTEWALANGWTIDEIVAKDVPEGKPFEIVSDDAIPSDRTFRVAWKKVGSIVEPDIGEARVIHMDRIREERNKELDKSDSTLIRAMEAGDNLTNMRVERQKLRDIPQTIDLESAQTSEELNAIWPDDLPRP